MIECLQQAAWKLFLVVYRHMLRPIPLKLLSLAGLNKASHACLTVFIGTITFHDHPLFELEDLADTELRKVYQAGQGHEQAD